MTTRSQKMPSRQRFYLLDGLRLFAALAVLAYHYTAFKQNFWGVPAAENFQFISRFSAYGAMGVELFFVISGFVILMSAQGRSIGDFVASRISRLFPAYLVAVLAVAFLFVVVAPGQFKVISVPQVLANLTMIQQGLGVPHLDGVYWTLWIELLFYVMIGAFIKIGMTEGRIMAFAFLWPTIGAIAATANAEFIVSILNPTYAPFFAGGMVLFLIHKYGHSTLRWSLFAFNVCVGVQQCVKQLVSGSIPRNTGVDTSPTWGAIVVICIFTLVALVTVTPLATKGPKWLALAGALTYPLYLFHEAWGWWIISLLADSLNKWVVLLCATAFSVVLAWLVLRFIERPIGPVLNRALKKEHIPRTDTRSDQALETSDSSEALVR